VLLSFFLNVLATVMSLNLFLKRFHLSLSRVISLMHSSHFFLSDVEEVFSTEESGIGVSFGLVVIFCFFSRGRGVRVGNVKRNIFHFLGGSDCSIAATIASIISWDDVKGGSGSGLILWGMGGKWESFVFDGDSEDGYLVVNQDHDCLMVDIDGIKGCSWSPGGPVVDNVEVSVSDKGSEEVELIVVGMHVDKDDSIVGAQGEDSRGSEACAGEFMVD